jgi:hypothetical protein
VVTPVVCDDGNPCTADACSAGGCASTPTSAPCDDGDVCTEDDQCLGGTCLGPAVVCDDADACTTDACVDGVGCVFTPVSAQCGTCAAGATIACGDSVPGSVAPGAGGTIPAYPCKAGTFPAPESVLTFTAVEAGTATALLSTAGAGLSILVVEEVGGKCGAQSCLAAGTTSVTFATEAGATYHLIVDGATQPAGATYDLTLGCTPAP